MLNKNFDEFIEKAVEFDLYRELKEKYQGAQYVVDQEKALVMDEVRNGIAKLFEDASIDVRIDERILKNLGGAVVWTTSYSSTMNVAELAKIIAKADGLEITTVDDGKTEISFEFHNIAIRED